MSLSHSPLAAVIVKRQGPARLSVLTQSFASPRLLTALGAVPFPISPFVTRKGRLKGTIPYETSCNPTPASTLARHPVRLHPDPRRRYGRRSHGDGACPCAIPEQQRGSQPQGASYRFGSGKESGPADKAGRIRD